MTNKKAQGLSTRFIVLLIIALIILAIVVGFASGAFGRLFGSVATYEETSRPSSGQAAKFACSNACNEAKALVKIESDWKGSTYCNLKHNIDLNADGKIEGDEKDIDCWEEPISISCEVKNVEIGNIGKDNCCEPGNCPCKC